MYGGNDTYVEPSYGDGSADHLPASTAYRLVGGDLSSSGSWDVWAVRFLASPDCEGDAIAHTATNAAGSGAYCSNPTGSDFIESMCKLNNGPSNGFTGNPEIPSKPYSGVPDEAGAIWLSMQFDVPTAVGCVQVFQKTYQSAGSIGVEARDDTDGGSWYIVSTQHDTNACGNTACCAIAQEDESFEVSWACADVTSIRLLPDTNDDYSSDYSTYGSYYSSDDGPPPPPPPPPPDDEPPPPPPNWRHIWIKTAGYHPLRHGEGEEDEGEEPADGEEDDLGDAVRLQLVIDEALDDQL